jgi:hypothetical protein
MKRILITVGVSLITLLLAWVLHGLFSGNLTASISLQFGGLFGNPSMTMYVPIIAIAVPIALWWAVKVIRRKK